MAHALLWNPVCATQSFCTMDASAGWLLVQGCLAQLVLQAQVLSASCRA